MADRLVDQHLRLLPRAIYAEQENEGRLARLGVLAQRLAGARAVALDIQQVIGNLKGKAQVACIAAQGRAAFRRYSAHDCARFEAKADERTRRQLLEPGRWEEPRVGKECVMTSKTRWWWYQAKKTTGGCERV